MGAVMGVDRDVGSDDYAIPDEQRKKLLSLAATILAFAEGRYDVSCCHDAVKKAHDLMDEISDDMGNYEMRFMR
jgi:hypothetical protein